VEKRKVDRSTLSVLFQQMNQHFLFDAIDQRGIVEFANQDVVRHQAGAKSLGRNLKHPNHKYQQKWIQTEVYWKQK
jgi:hypothetical protein